MNTTPPRPQPQQQRPRPPAPTLPMWKRMLQPLNDPRVWVWLMLALMARETVVWGLSKASMGMVDLKSQEQKLVECIIRQMNNEDFKLAESKLAGIKGCIPKDVEKDAEGT